MACDGSKKGVTFLLDSARAWAQPFFRWASCAIWIKKQPFPNEELEVSRGLFRLKFLRFQSLLLLSLQMVCGAELFKNWRPLA